MSSLSMLGNVASREETEKVEEKKTDPPTVNPNANTIAGASSIVVATENSAESKVAETKTTTKVTDTINQAQAQPEPNANLDATTATAATSTIIENDKTGKDALEEMDTRSGSDNNAENSESLKPEDLLKVVKKYEPLIPVPVIKHYLERAGCEMTDDDHVRVVALAAQKLIGDIVSDARIRIIGKTPSKRRSDNDSGEDVLKLTTADLSPCLVEQGVQVRKPEFYLHTDSTC
uniref:Transcription initiation factor TFIID subunit 10 n=1 Tax=Aplanochytrium stocchinoi TaxID=215587 RepID=A0A6S8EV17_9STRA